MIECDVNFEGKFSKVPFAIFSLSKLDAGVDENMHAGIRVHAYVKADSVTQHGMTVVLATWGETGMTTMGASWIAIGE